MCRKSWPARPFIRIAKKRRSLAKKNEQKSSRHVLPEDGKLKNIAAVISSRRSFSEVPHGRTFDGKTPDDHVCFHGVSH
jgi:hypothetical protein